MAGEGAQGVAVVLGRAVGGPLACEVAGDLVGKPLGMLELRVDADLDVCTMFLIQLWTWAFQWATDLATSEPMVSWASKMVLTKTWRSSNPASGCTEQVESVRWLVTLRRSAKVRVLRALVALEVTWQVPLSVCETSSRRSCSWVQVMLWTCSAVTRLR